jgi:hypothetical protein
MRVAPSTNKTNKFIPYHLIVSKHKYYGIKLYVFYDLFLLKVVSAKHRSTAAK